MEKAHGPDLICRIRIYILSRSLRKPTGRWSWNPQLNKSSISLSHWRCWLIPGQLLAEPADGVQEQRMAASSRSRRSNPNVMMSLNMWDCLAQMKLLFMATTFRCTTATPLLDVCYSFYSLVHFPSHFLFSQFLSLFSLCRYYQFVKRSKQGVLQRMSKMSKSHN